MLRRLALRISGSLPPSLVDRLQRLRQRNATVGHVLDRVAARLRAGSGVVRGGAAEGLRLEADMGKLSYLTGTSEQVVQEHLVASLTPGKVFYDVGANVGFFSLLAARLVGPEGLVVAWEPVPASASVLRRNVASNGFDNVVVDERAVSSHVGRGSMTIPGNPVGARLANGGDPHEGSATIEVDIVTIDSLVASGEIPPPDVVKLDVEGAEVDVLAGMDATLGSARPILLVELHGTAETVREVLAARGFRIEELDDGGGLDNPHLAAYPPA